MSANFAYAGPGLTASCPPPEVSLESSHRGFHLLFVAFGCGFGFHVCYMTRYIFFLGGRKPKPWGLLAGCKPKLWGLLAGCKSKAWGLLSDLKPKL